VTLLDTALTAFLVVQLPAGATAGEDPFTPIAAALERAGGTVLVQSPPTPLEVLEPGTPPEPTLIVRFAGIAALREAWQTVDAQSLPPGFRAFAGAGLPPEGLPHSDLPTRANARPVEAEGPVAFMLVEGTATDQVRMGRYRDMIRPMILERGGYYVAYAPPAGVEVLVGERPPQALILSRWPTLGAARDFWYSERYQTEAIPTRTGAGEFRVLLFAAR
jgi:uncharacterized protein (DUF1330 family)